MRDRAQGGATRISLPATSSPSTVPSSGSSEFGSKEGDFRVTEFPEFAQFAEPAGRTSIGIPFHNHFRAPTAEETEYVTGVLERALGEVQ